MNRRGIRLSIGALGGGLIFKPARDRPGGLKMNVAVRSQPNKDLVGSAISSSLHQPSASTRPAKTKSQLAYANELRARLMNVSISTCTGLARITMGQ